MSAGFGPASALAVVVAGALPSSTTGSVTDVAVAAAVIVVVVASSVDVVVVVAGMDLVSSAQTRMAVASRSYSSM